MQGDSMGCHAIGDLDQGGSALAAIRSGIVVAYGGELRAGFGVESERAALHRRTSFPDVRTRTYANSDHA